MFWVNRSFPHLSWATWAICWRSLIYLECSEQIAHSRLFDWSEMSEWVMSKWTNSQPCCQSMLCGPPVSPGWNRGGYNYLDGLFHLWVTGGPQTVAFKCKMLAVCIRVNLYMFFWKRVLILISIFYEIKIKYDYYANKRPWNQAF